MSRREGPNSNATVQGKLRSREKLAEIQRRADVAEIMGLPSGRRFIYSTIFDECGLMNLYPAQDSGIYRHEGRRSIGFNLAAEIQRFHPEEYVQMITEHIRDQENEKKIRDAALTTSEGEQE